MKGVRNFENKVTVTVALQEKNALTVKFLTWMSPWTVLKGCAGVLWGSSQKERPASLPGVAEKLSEKVESYLQHQYSFKLKILPISTSVLIINIYEHKIRYGLSAAVLALIGAGASAPRYLTSFWTKKKVTTQWHTAMFWHMDHLSGCHSGGWKNRFSNMKLSKEKCDQVNAIERDKRWHGWSAILKYHWPNHKKRVRVILSL